MDDDIQKTPYLWLKALDLCSRAGLSVFARSFPVAEFHNSVTALRLSAKDTVPIVAPSVTGHWAENLPRGNDRDSKTSSSLVS